ncbi:hypothetical protein HPB50_015747 [Hyalomma asiaticum]|uniref:Uncharacterized protein n=1 Tax=Hyalomma asiaticum TaxID=266040 RepID=A0ACB7S7C3_HYAAI|nr:hypothetical protein HPB50_015747 [Hyalomma asiaticum]
MSTTSVDTEDNRNAKPSGSSQQTPSKTVIARSQKSPYTEDNRNAKPSGSSQQTPSKTVIARSQKSPWLTNLATACSERKAAIIEDVPRTFTSAHTMAHEIGHLVGSAHDGSKNPDSSVDPTACPAQEKKIMAPGMGTYMSYEFSYCSTAQIAQFTLVGSVHDDSTNNKMTVDGTSCPAAERKIMAPYAGAMNLVQKFSYCSTCQVAEFIM